VTKCAICGKRKCVDTSTKHLLASFDLTFDGQGLHGAGLGGGALYKVKEIGDLLQAIRRARVASWAKAPKGSAPPAWIRARPDLTSYFRALGDDGFNPSQFRDLEEATDFIHSETGSHGSRVRELLESLLDDAGWSGITSDDEDDVPLASSSYALWWDDDAEGTAKRLGQRIVTILANAR
jgi:hypothetical protein